LKKLFKTVFHKFKLRGINNNIWRTIPISIHRIGISPCCKKQLHSINSIFRPTRCSTVKSSALVKTTRPIDVYIR
jgi:hypothetical protein